MTPNHSNGKPERARIILVSAAKGGVGKSTTSALLSSCFGMSYDTVWVDADSQGASQTWFLAAAENRRLPVTFEAVPAAGRSLSKRLEQLSLVHQVVVVDLPNSISDEAPLSAMLVADAVIIPTRPSPLDVRTCLVDTAQMIEKAKRVNPTLQARFLVNMYRKTNVADSLLAVMASAGAPLLRSRLGDRNSFRLAAGIGSVPKFMGSAHRIAAAETSNVFEEVRELLFGEAQ